MTELSDSSADLLQLFLSFFPDIQFPELSSTTHTAIYLYRVQAWIL
jgi:hypothetical protein